MGQKQWCQKSEVTGNNFMSTTNRFKESRVSGCGFVAPESTLVHGGSRSCFRSSSQRFTVKRAAGEGDPNDRRSYSASSRRSNSSSSVVNGSVLSARSGRSTSTFTSTPRFRAPGDALAATQPGPGCYTPSRTDSNGNHTIEGLAQRISGKKKMSAQFASSSSRFANSLLNKPSPAPGDYEIKIVNRDTPQHQFGKYRDTRFRTNKEAAAVPGVSTYNVKRFGDNPKRAVNTPRGFIAFGSTTTRFNGGAEA